MRASGLSLWLLPERAAGDALRRTIAALAGRHGAPAFEPHLTLVGGLGQGEPAALACARRLADGARPLEAGVVRVGWRPEFFRCLFLEIEAAPALAALEKEVRAELAPAAPLFFPHVSLLYGRLAEAEKPALAASLAERLPGALRFDALGVVRTEGEVREWRTVAELPLLRRG